MSRDKRPLGGIIEDHYLGTQGVYTGGLANDIGLQEYKRRQQQKESSYPVRTNSGSSYKSNIRTEPLTDHEFENAIAGFICLALAGTILYFGLVVYRLQWYFPVGACFISVLVVYKILTGPLRIILSLIRWAIYIAFFAGVCYGILSLYNVVSG